MTQTSLFSTPPYQRHSEESRAAAKAIVDSLSKLQARVLAYVASCPYGATDEEIQHALRMNPSTQRPRRLELFKLGLIDKAPYCRRTRAGRKAAVWIVYPAQDPCTAAVAPPGPLCGVCHTVLRGKQQYFCSDECRMVWHGRRAS